MRPAVPIAIVALALGLLAGCGSSDDGNSGTTAPKATESTAPAGATAQTCSGKAGAASALRATGVSCQRAKRLAVAWTDQGDCAPADGASRSSCTLEGAYDCLAAVTDRGIAVSCARPERSVAFTVKSG